MMDWLRAALRPRKNVAEPGIDAIVARHAKKPPEPPEPSGIRYIDFFRAVNAQLQPQRYFEIGTQTGQSLAAFDCDAVCVDPNFMLDKDVIGKRKRAFFFQMGSDEFFADFDPVVLLGAAPDICFLDGMHWAEFLLRDFINTERCCNPASLIFLHDCLPSNVRMARRSHDPGDPSEGKWQYAWTGDVWKMLPVLKAYRPDLKIAVLDCRPTGLVGITGLDPASTVLKDRYEEALALMAGLALETYTIRKLWTQYPVVSAAGLTAAPDDLRRMFRRAPSQLPA